MAAFAAVAAMLAMGPQASAGRGFSSGDSSAGRTIATTLVAKGASVLDPTQACPALTQADFSTLAGAPTELSSASLTTLNGKQYCQIDGYVAPQVQFQLDLPTASWNGNFLFVGCGGFCGTTASSVVHAGSTTNYAIVTENEGHFGTSELDGMWALNNTPAQIDWGYRAVHVVAVASKQIISTFYGTQPRFSYFDGCSDGGREGLSEAQRYPTDFNGIAAGDPNWLQNYLAAVAQGWVQKINYTASGQQILPSSKLGLFSAAVYKQCAGPNGLISDPAACEPDLTSLLCPTGLDNSTCLTPAQLKVVEQLYQGPVNSRGQSLYPGGGLPAGSELGWAYLDVAAPGQSLPFAAVFANQYLKYLAFTKPPAPTYSVSQFNFNTDLHLLTKQGQVYNADNSNLSAFKAAGGKLILYHGLSDPLISPYGTLYYYDEVTDLMGGVQSTQQFARLFMVPGMYHCAGGPGVSTFDVLTPLTQWVEGGTPPSDIPAQHLDGAGNVTLSLPLYPYPAYPKYSGTGDPTQAANYVEATPPNPVDADYCWIGRHGGDTGTEHGPSPDHGRCVQPPGLTPSS